jgi:hypothetical protein
VRYAIATLAILGAITAATLAGGGGGNSNLTATCLSTSNVPGHTDPWGGCWPGPQNTGIPDSVTPTAYTGPCGAITTPGTIIDGKTIGADGAECDLDIRTTGVVIKNSMMYGELVMNDSFTTSATITDTTIDAGPLNNNIPVGTGDRAIKGSNFTATRVETTRGCCGIWAGSNTTVQDSWIHGQDDDEGGDEHQSGYRQGEGGVGNGQNLLHNSVGCDAHFIDDGDGDAAGCSAVITGYGDFATVQNNYNYRNLIVAPNSGVFCAYGGATASKPFPLNTNNVWTGNVFQRNVNGKCADFSGGWAVTDLDQGSRGNVWSSDNIYDDGTTMPVPH